MLRASGIQIRELFLSSPARISAALPCTLADPANTAGIAVAAGAADCPDFEKMTSSLLMCGAEDAGGRDAEPVCE